MLITFRALRVNATGQAARCRQYYYQTVKITMIVDGANVSDK